MELRKEKQCYRCSEEAAKDECSLSAQRDRITFLSCFSPPLAQGHRWAPRRRPWCNGRVDGLGAGSCISADLPRESGAHSAWLGDAPIPPHVCTWLQIWSSSWDKFWEFQPGIAAARKTLDPVPLTHDFLPLMKSLQQDAAGWFYTAEVAGMQLVLGKLHLLHLAGRGGKMLVLEWRVHRDPGVQLPLEAELSFCAWFAVECQGQQDNLNVKTYSKHLLTLCPESIQIFWPSSFLPTEASI